MMDKFDSFGRQKSGAGVRTGCKHDSWIVKQQRVRSQEHTVDDQWLIRHTAVLQKSRSHTSSFICSLFVFVPKNTSNYLRETAELSQTFTHLLYVDV